MASLLQVLQIAAPVVLLAAIGYGWVRRGWNHEFVTRLAMTLSIPWLIVMALVHSDVDQRLLRHIVLATLGAYTLVGVVVWGMVRALDAAVGFGVAGNSRLFCLTFPLHREPFLAS